MDSLERLRQKTFSTEDYMVKFKNLVSQAELNDKQRKIRLYQRGLNPRVFENVMKTRPPPGTFDEWCNAAAKENNQYQRTAQILGKRIPFCKGNCDLAGHEAAKLTN